MMPTALIWCALAASVRYDVPADALLSVYSVERGSTDTWSHDANGTYDVGPLQFNTAYLASLRRFGITPRAVEGKTCYPWFLAAWRIHDQLVEDRGGFWTRVARYHSATPRYVATYRRQLLEYAPRWRAWLIAHYPTVVSLPSFHSAAAPARASRGRCPLALLTPRARPWTPLAEPRRLWDYRRSEARERRSTASPLPGLHSAQMIAPGVKVWQMVRKPLSQRDPSGLQSRPQRFDSAPSLQ